MIRHQSWLGIAAVSAALVCAASAHSDESGVMDLSSANVEAIQSGDIVEALAVPRGTRIRASAPPTVRLPVYFAFGSAELEPDAVQLLEKVSTALGDEDLVAFRFSVEGHTDSIGGESTNEQLSLRRAEAVESFLIARGVPAARLSAVGHGESEPIASNDEEMGRKRNRRVEIINLGESK